jgi:hypothetical protein
LNSVSLKSQLESLRAFLSWCESIDAAEQDIRDKPLSPSLNDGDREPSVLLKSDAATDIVECFAPFEYASLHHALLSPLWRCGARSGTVDAS